MNGKIIKLYMDDREDSKRINSVTEYNPEYHPQVKHLKYGDYHYITDTGERIIFEYKTGSDFLNSIQDNHLHNQVYNMKKHYNYTFLMICVSDWEYLLQSYKRMTGIELTMKRIAGQITWFNCHTTVLTAKNIPNSIYLMKRQSEKIVDDKPLLYKFNKKSPNYAENRLNCIHGISSELATSITDTLNLKSEKDLLDLTVDDLRIVEGIGYKKAENILTSLHGA